MPLTFPAGRSRSWPWPGRCTRAGIFSFWTLYAKCFRFLIECQLCTRRIYIFRCLDRLCRFWFRHIFGNPVIAFSICLCPRLSTSRKHHPTAYNDPWQRSRYALLCSALSPVLLRLLSHSHSTSFPVEYYLHATIVNSPGNFSLSHAGCSSNFLSTKPLPITALIISLTVYFL